MLVVGYFDNGLKSIIKVISFSTGCCNCFNLIKFKRD